MNDKIELEFKTSRFVHTQDQYEPFVYEGDTYRKLPNGKFEIWACNYEKMQAHKDAMYLNWKEDHKHWEENVSNSGS